MLFSVRLESVTGVMVLEAVEALLVVEVARVFWGEEVVSGG